MQIKEKKQKQLIFLSLMEKRPRDLLKIGIVASNRLSKLLSHGLMIALKFKNGKKKNNKQRKIKNILRLFLEDTEDLISFLFQIVKRDLITVWDCEEPLILLFRVVQLI